MMSNIHKLRWYHWILIIVYSNLGTCFTLAVFLEFWSFPGGPLYELFEPYNNVLSFFGIIFVSIVGGNYILGGHGVLPWPDLKPDDGSGEKKQLN